MTIAPPSRQPLLLHMAPSFNITKNAQARNAYGTIAQEIVCAALGAVPIPINGNYDCCFDAKLHDRYFEIKSVHQKGKVVIYDWRMKKEATSKVDLGYAILIHKVRRSNGKNLLQDFIKGGLQLLVIPSVWIHSLAMEFPLNHIKKDSSNPRFGHNRNGYKDGYRNIPIAYLLTLAIQQEPTQVFYAGETFSIERFG